MADRLLNLNLPNFAHARNRKVLPLLFDAGSDNLSFTGRRAWGREQRAKSKEQGLHHALYPMPPAPSPLPLRPENLLNPNENLLSPSPSSIADFIINRLGLFFQSAEAR
jgi:hypothetical protein